MPLPSFLTNIIGNGAGNIVESIGNVADKFIQTKEEKDKFNAEMQKIVNEHAEKMEAMAVDELKAQLADTASARDSNVKIQESDKASWMSKNVPYIIACTVTIVWAACTLYLIGKAIKVINDNADMTAVLSLYSTITAVFMTVLTFYFGSSASSERKQKLLDSYIKQK